MGTVTIAVGYVLQIFELDSNVRIAFLDSVCKWPDAAGRDSVSAEPYRAADAFGFYVLMDMVEGMLDDARLFANQLVRAFPFAVSPERARAVIPCVGSNRVFKFQPSVQEE